MAETINVKKLNKPLMHSNEYIYPITTDDQVIVGDKRLPAALTDKVNTSDVLSLEEIEASSDLLGKVASAEAIKNVAEILPHKMNVAFGALSGLVSTIEVPATSNIVFVFYRNSNAIYALDGSSNVQEIVAGSSITNISVNTSASTITVTRNNSYSGIVMMIY